MRIKQKQLGNAGVSACFDKKTDRVTSTAYALKDDATLLAALGNNDSAAYHEIAHRYTDLVFRCAANLSVDRFERKEWVSDLLHDVLLTLLKPTTAMPESLTAYLIRACRNKAYASYRATDRRRRRESKAYEVVPGNETVVNGTCSQHSLRSSRAVDQEALEPSPVVIKLCVELDRMMTAEEKQILDWSCESVPVRVIGAWMGVSSSAIAHRVSRLRGKLRRSVPAIIAGFPPCDQLAITRFLSRGGHLGEPHLAPQEGAQSYRLMNQLSGPALSRTRTSLAQA